MSQSQNNKFWENGPKKKFLHFITTVYNFSLKIEKKSRTKRLVKPTSETRNVSDVSVFVSV